MVEGIEIPRGAIHQTQVDVRTTAEAVVLLSVGPRHQHLSKRMEGRPSDVPLEGDNWTELSEVPTQDFSPYFLNLSYNTPMILIENISQELYYFQN